MVESQQQMIDTSGSRTFEGLFKLNDIIILRPTSPINWSKEVTQDVISGLITDRITSVVLENIVCVPEVLGELFDLVMAQQMHEDGLKELRMKNIKLLDSSFTKPVFCKLFACCESLEKLEVSDMKQSLSPRAQQDLVVLITQILLEEPALKSLNLSGISSSCEHGNKILQALRKSTSYGLVSLNLGSNDAWWGNSDGNNLTSLIRIINNQEQLK